MTCLSFPPPSSRRGSSSKDTRIATSSSFRPTAPAARPDLESAASDPRGQGLVAHVLERGRGDGARGGPGAPVRGCLSAPAAGRARRGRRLVRGPGPAIDEGGEEGRLLRMPGRRRDPPGRRQRSRSGARRASSGERKNDTLARRGVVFLDPSSAWIDWAAEIGPRTVVYPSVVIEGPTRIGADGRILPARPHHVFDPRRPGEGLELHGHGGHGPGERRPGRSVLPLPAEDPGLRRGQGGQLRRDEEHRLRPRVQGPAPELRRRQHRRRRASTSAPARSPAITTASRRIPPASAPGPSSARGRSSSPRSRSGGAPTSPRARRSPETWPPGPWPSPGPARSRNRAGSLERARARKTGRWGDKP